MDAALIVAATLALAILPGALFWENTGQSLQFWLGVFTGVIFCLLSGFVIIPGLTSLFKRDPRDRRPRPR